jgi:hypothetical protein
MFAGSFRRIFQEQKNNTNAAIEGWFHASTFIASSVNKFEL